ncbi:MAG TPA: YciI family protein [Streptosporangiaceae bacterium]|nr:YciI family protein [Streptosporangiaceae bacterium]
MMHVLILRYTVPIESAEPHVPDHAEYLQRQHADGVFVLSGQAVPPEDGEVIVATGLDRTQIEQLAATDPLVTAGVGAYEILTIPPDRAHPDLADVLGLPAVADTGWDAESFRALSIGKGAMFLLASRPLEPVLQHAGQALLAELAAASPGADSAARRCAEGLESRSWEGDDQLALELRHALGEPVSAGEFGVPRWPLDTVPVNLADLAEHLDGDPSQGHGLVDLQAGMVWPPGSVDYDPPPEMDAESDDYDEDRWLSFSPESGEGYRDMLRFTDYVNHEQLRQRLLDALDGRGAFRRFRDVVHSAPEDVLTRWRIYSQERELGRARAWLAYHGYRSVP